MKSNVLLTALTLLLCCLTLQANAQWLSSGTNIRNTNTGKVGIGTGASTPAYKLHVVGDRIRLGNNTTATAKTIDIRVDGTQVDIFANNAHLFLGSTTGNTIIQGFGRKVGIGTGSPDSELHIVGTESNGTSGTLTINSGTQKMVLDGNEIDALSQGLYLQNNSVGNIVMVNGGGSVRIGTTATPTAKLDVEGPENNGTTGTVKITSPSGTMLLDGNEIDVIAGTANKVLEIQKNSTGDIILARGGGKVGVGALTTAPTAKLHVNGDVLCFNIFTNSDRRYKTGIRTFEGALGKVLALRGTSYDFAAGQLPADYTAGKQVGFIAQEMQEVMPELVKEDAEGMLSVNYIGVIPVLVEALKEQHEVIAEKETRIAALEAQNTALQDRLARIEAALGLATDRQSANEKTTTLTATVSPNPTSGMVTISLHNVASAKSVTVKIMDSAGREVASRNAAGENSIQFDLGQFPVGVYVAQVVADGQMVSSNKVQLVK